MRGLSPARIHRSLASGWLGLEDHAFAGLAVHEDRQWRRESQVAHAAMFLNCGLGRQPFPINEALAGIRVDGKVADLKRGEILKEMAALRRNHPEIAKSRLYNNARSGNL